jgi:hypothetical protein
MPPRPISPLILYFLANIVPFSSAGTGGTMVFVKDGRSCPSGLSGAAQLLQNREVSGLSERQREHFTDGYPLVF